MSARPDAWLLERRGLLEHLIKDSARSGAQVRCPPGHGPFSPASPLASSLLDSLDTDALLKQLQQRGAVLDLGRCLRPGGPATASFGPGAPFSGTATASAVASIPSYNLGNGLLQLKEADPSNPFSVSAAEADSNPFASAVKPSVTDSQAKPHSNGGAFPSAAPAVAPAALAVLEPAELGLQQLRTGLDDHELHDLAFCIFVTCIHDEAEVAPLADTMRVQLRLDKAQATQAHRLAARLAADGTQKASMRVSLEGAVRALECVRPEDFAAAQPSKSAVTLPGPGAGQQDAAATFRLFRSWQRSQAAVIRSGFERNVEDSWATADWGLAKKLLARLRAALRRLDCSSPDDLDEEEYGEAVRHLGATARQLAGSCRAGWQLPWGTRVRVAELLLAALFDHADPSTQVEEATSLTSLLERRVWPVLGVGPVLQQGVAAWVYFKQYLVTHDARQLRQLKYLMSKVLTQTEVAPDPSDAFNLGQDVVATDANRRDAGWDHELAAHVAACIVDHCAGRLADYYAAFPDGASMQGLLDVLAFASRSRGDDDDALSRQLAALVQSSTLAELQRRTARVQRGAAPGDALQAVLEAAQELHLQQQPGGGGSGHAQVMESQLQGAGLLADAVLYAQVGKLLAPWLATVTTLDAPTLQLLRSAIVFDNALGPALQQATATATAAAAKSMTMSATAALPAATAASPAPSTAPTAFPGASDDSANKLYPPIPRDPSGKPSSVPDSFSNANPIPDRTSFSKSLAGGALGGVAGGAKVSPLLKEEPLRTFQRWDLGTTVRRSLEPWVASRVHDLATWTQRQLGQETWKPVARAHGCAQVAVEVVRMCEGVLDAAFGLGLPLPRDAVQALLVGIDAALTKCGTHITSHVGSASRLLPAKPPITRFKRDVVAAQEAAEVAARAGKPPPGQSSGRLLGALAGKKKDKRVPDVGEVWLHSVPQIQSSPDYVNLSQTLTRPALLACCQSAALLKDQAELLAVGAAERWQGQGQQPSVWPSASPPGPDSAAWARSFVEPSRTALEAALVHTINFLATKVVFWDLRHEWLEQLYRHHVYSSRITDVLELTNQALGEICGSLGPGLQARFAMPLLKGCAAAYEWVLLDGGPCRWFTPADVPQLEQDVAQLRSLFYADGQGLPKEVVDAELRRVGELLRPMALELGPLMDLFKEAQVRGSCTMQYQNKPLVFSDQVMMKIVARRPDRTSSKVLKDKYKIPKKLPVALK